MTLHIEIDRDTEKRLAHFAKATGQKIDTLASKILKQGIKAREKNERECIEDEKSWHIEQELFTFAKNLLKEDGDAYFRPGCAGEKFQATGVQ